MLDNFASVLFAGQSVGLVKLPLMLFHYCRLMVCAALARGYAIAAAEWSGHGPARTAPARRA